jgi:transitional endoplasmic reticulum ATPase
MHSHERWAVRRYLANALTSPRYRRAPPPGAELLAWIGSHALQLDLPRLGAHPPAKGLKGAFRAGSDSGQGVASSDANWRAWRAAAIASVAEAPKQTSPLQRRLDWLAEACALEDGQSHALGLLARATMTPAVTALIDALNERFRLEGVACDVTELEPLLATRALRNEFSSGNRLSSLGLIDVRDGLQLSVVTRRILALPRLASRRIAHLLLGQPAAASLAWSDFAFLGAPRELVARIVAAATSRDATDDGGVNLLFYGPPGTGKTEFAKTLGARLGLSVQFVGEISENCGEPNRRERLAALMIANAIGAVSRETILVIDEADDLFIGRDGDEVSDRHGSKVFMNRLIERVAAPVVWIVNDVDRLGPATIRRMTLALRFPRPSLSARRNMVARIAAETGFALSEAEAADLAAAPAAPALIGNAIRAAKAFEGDASDARGVLAASLSALGGNETPTIPTSFPFDPSLSSADVDLAALADRVAKARGVALSFCLSGPPGTGKSAYARWLAERLELEVVEKRFSDLASMYVGESEKAITRAFEEAADLYAFLIFDEADSLLRDRRAARNGWEITEVNEMLSHMERHPYPFACTTNAPDLLDPAVARRFVFKVQFLSMTPDRIALAYRRAFGHRAPECVMNLANLTPGDFALVARKARLLDERDAGEIAKWLRAEALSKPEAGRRRIGF